jgi:hypothetical protein
MKRESDTLMMEAPVQPATLRFQVTDVTGTRELEVEVAADTPAGAVARTLAEQMHLPDNVPWALRDDRGGFCDDTRQVGEMVGQDARVWIVPKTHLG